MNPYRITYRKVSQKPVSFKSLTGLSVPEFDELCRQWYYADAVAREESPLTRTKRTPRKRRPGAGRKWALDAPTRLLMALVWLKVYPTWEVLGYLFGVDERTARRSTRDVLEVLQGLATFPLEKRERGRAQPGKAFEQVMEEHPVLEVLLDSREQRVRRPTGQEAQRPYYSGKKKAHTMKMQATVSVEGRVQAISESVPGTTSDLELLDQSGVVEQLEPGEAAGMDKGYVGVDKRHPEHGFFVPCKKPRGGELTKEQASYNRALSRARMPVEHLFGRMSYFGAVYQVFRHRRQRHSGVVRVVAWLADRKIERCLAAAGAKCA
jgi:hypothetical protein